MLVKVNCCHTKEENEVSDLIATQPRLTKRHHYDTTCRLQLRVAVDQRLNVNNTRLRYITSTSQVDPSITTGKQRPNLAAIKPDYDIMDRSTMLQRCTTCALHHLHSLSTA